MKPQMFSILNILMKKQRLKGTGKLYFLTMSCSLRFLSKYLFSRILESKFSITYVLISSGLNFHRTGSFPVDWHTKAKKKISHKVCLAMQLRSFFFQICLFAIWTWSKSLYWYEVCHDGNQIGSGKYYKEIQIDSI